METTTPASPRRQAAILLVGSVLVIALACVMFLPAYNRQQSGPLQIRDGSDQRARIETLFLSFLAFREAHGRFPVSQDEWAGFEADAERLLDAAPASVEPRYSIRWDAFGERDCVVTMSSDRDFSGSPMWMSAGAKRRTQVNANTNGFNRVVLMGGEGVPHGRDVPWQAKKDFAEWAGWTFGELPTRER